jgi:hypothetical protein
MHQLDVKPKKHHYSTTNLGHGTHACYHRHKEIHAAMGVQVYTEISKMRTSLRDSSVCHYMSIPIGNRTMENIAGNIGKISLQTPYAPMTHNIPAIMATGMENKDTKEGTQSDVTRYSGTTKCTSSLASICISTGMSLFRSLFVKLQKNCARGRILGSGRKDLEI